jgi:hypothetical protein
MSAVGGKRTLEPCCEKRILREVASRGAVADHPNACDADLDALNSTGVRGIDGSAHFVAQNARRMAAIVEVPAIRNLAQTMEGDLFAHCCFFLWIIAQYPS